MVGYQELLAVGSAKYENAETHSQVLRERRNQYLPEPHLYQKKSRLLMTASELSCVRAGSTEKGRAFFLGSWGAYSIKIMVALVQARKMVCAHYCPIHSGGTCRRGP